MAATSARGHGMCGRYNRPPPGRLYFAHRPLARASTTLISLTASHRTTNAGGPEDKSMGVQVII